MASFSVPCAKSSVLLRSSPLIPSHNLKQNHFFGFQIVNVYDAAIKDRILFFNHDRLWSSQNQFRTLKVHAQVNEVAVEKSLNSAPIIEITSEEKGKQGIPDLQSIAAFMNQVADLIKLIDSRDIVELQLKQPVCEITIRKKEALPQPGIAPPVITMQATPPTILPSPLPPSEQVTPPTSSSPAAMPSAPEAHAPPQPSKSSHPPLKCPMAGTFYRSPAPGAPPFVKVGDKVQKGQVVCIIEAMKLMNEIEADQSGTIVEILAEDGKPVSVDTPLFVIEP
ncbi:PREDICTED: biotin carboxyl carrier protein of acetyl-CoA carboxylase 2, chloroplastic-like [Theobroma cacao]|uniref:Biotin carboxyl carrier protein of acetyl-CoA carboxylase n=1 Tax=Theobroma cacao TaxID=3641 RepID=A0AB32W381_THECC|nr:PREDICTED: biotin carboxyl carrier protein of acetyl-CoA carboxylase 2, chloroplastic-like [Theobroma cacao]